LETVIAGLDPAIQIASQPPEARCVDARIKPEHDELALTSRL
jgi:hypothetical protein